MKVINIPFSMSEIQKTLCFNETYLVALETDNKAGDT